MSGEDVVLHLDSGPVPGGAVGYQSHSVVGARPWVLGIPEGLYGQGEAGQPPDFLRWLKSPIRAAAFLLLLAVFLAAGNVALILQEWPVHSAMYARLASNLESGGIILADPDRLLTFPDGLSATAMRDMGFYLFNIRPEAKSWMEQLPISYEPSAELAGWYRMDNRTLVLGQPYMHVILHEYAHADLHHKGLAEKAGLILGMARLVADATPENRQARAVFLGVLAEGSHTMREGRSYGVLHEAYAYLAQWSGGDLAALPKYLQPFYVDYLTPGPNRWLELQAGG